MDNVTQWLLASDEPWTVYRTSLDLLGESPSDPAVCSAREKLIRHPQVNELVAAATAWGDTPFKRHNDAGYAIYKISTLADFGLRADDPGMDVVVQKIMAHSSPEGAFQSVVNIPRSFGGDGEDHWTWMVCDSPTLLYSLLAFGLADDPRVQKAIAHLASLVDENGWRCVVDPALGKFRGPGRKTDPCPIANVYALKVLTLVPQLVDSPAAHAGAEMLLSHFANTPPKDDLSLGGAGGGSKYYLFGAGTDYRKLKYPFVWYDLLHVADVLSRFPFARRDPRFARMVDTICSQADADGRYTATSMYLSWKGWSFADKKNPSPWLTFLVHRIVSLRAS
jgi:hypothetical protein